MIKTEPKEITLNRGDDMHVHFRQGERMKAVVGFTARQFGRAIVMPNTKPYILSVDAAKKYRDQILESVYLSAEFQPLMTLYLQTTTSTDTIRAAKKSGFIHGIKMYPAGATTNSAGGVVKIQDIEEHLSVMQKVRMPLLIHGESADPNVDVFHRELNFYSEAFDWITKKFPDLPIVCEHVTTAFAVGKIVKSKHKNLGATITSQHLLENRNYMLGGHLRPHAFCKPILKSENDRIALLKAATSGNPRFFLGTDSAPHPKNGVSEEAKEVDCGCAGCFTAPAALEFYAQAFDSVGKIGMLNDFQSKFGREFYELPPNKGEIKLIKEEWQMEKSYSFGGHETVVPFRQEVPLSWKMVD